MAEGLARQWFEPPAVEVPEAFQEAIGGRPLVAQMLVRRGLSDLAAARAFIDPRQYHATPPTDMPGILAACERIERAIAASERICVWGDFDVDGQTSTTLLVSALSGLGAEVTYHIPVRARESHGVNVAHLAPIIDSGVTLIITCDTGISAHEAMEYARSRGVDVVLTDHHDLPETLPPACSISNPKLLPPDHPFCGLPGVGVAYLLAQALYERAGRAEEAESFLDLAALGIVADLAHQVADTRWLLQRGLAVLRQAKRPGLQAMFDLATLQPAYLTEEHIGFMIGPRLNALGRLDDANPIVEFFTTAEAGRARVLAAHLEGLNARRRLLTDQVLRGALSQIEKDSSLLQQAALVLAHPEWPAGVIGIVASELSERYNRPTVLLACPPGQAARGSARSVEGVNISAAIAAQAHLLLGYGGHPMAAGLSLESEKITAFRNGLSKAVERQLGGAAPRPSLTIDGTLALPDLTIDLVSDLERLAPFGPGNPSPVLCIPRLTILDSRTIGREGDHLQVTVKNEQDQTRRVIWWRGAGWPLPEGMFDLACMVRASNFRGQRDVQIEWVDARPVETERITLSRRTLMVIDQRAQSHPLPVLQGILAENTAQVWAEADGREKLAAAGITAADRSALTPCTTLIVWTSPPGRAELDTALEVARPQTVVLFGVHPVDVLPEAFLRRLTGLVKYGIEKLDGRVPLDRLAAAAGQRPATVRIGLEWLVAKGLVLFEIDSERMVTLRTAETEQKNTPGDNAPLIARLRALLDETAAYRQYFRSAEKDNLL